MDVRFIKKVFLPDGTHEVIVSDVSEVNTVAGERIAIRLTPGSGGFQDLILWIAAEEDAEGIAGKMLSRLVGDAEGVYSTEDLRRLLMGRVLLVKVKQNVKDGRVYVNIVDIVDVDISEDEDDEEDELEDDDDDDNEDDEPEPITDEERFTMMKQRRHPQSSYRR